MYSFSRLLFCSRILNKWRIKSPDFCLQINTSFYSASCLLLLFAYFERRMVKGKKKQATIKYGWRWGNGIVLRLSFSAKQPKSASRYPKLAKRSRYFNIEISHIAAISELKRMSSNGLFEMTVCNASHFEETQGVSWAGRWLRNLCLKLQSMTDFLDCDKQISHIALAYALS